MVRCLGSLLPWQCSVDCIFTWMFVRVNVLRFVSIRKRRSRSRQRRFRSTKPRIWFQLKADVNFQDKLRKVNCMTSRQLTSSRTLANYNINIYVHAYVCLNIYTTITTNFITLSGGAQSEQWAFQPAAAARRCFSEVFALCLFAGRPIETGWHLNFTIQLYTCVYIYI